MIDSSGNASTIEGVMSRPRASALIPTAFDLTYYRSGDPNLARLGEGPR